MARLGYGQAWLDAGVLDEALLDAQALEPEAKNPEHLRWAMWLAFAGRELRGEVPSSLLERLLALDLEESRAPSPNLNHSIAFYLASNVALGRGQIDQMCADPVEPSRVAGRALARDRRGAEAIPVTLINRHFVRRRLELANGSVY